MIPKRDDDQRLLKQLYSRLNAQPASRTLARNNFNLKQTNPLLSQVSHEMMGKSIFTKALKSKKYKSSRNC